jgi:hypothetical protein
MSRVDTKRLVPVVRANLVRMGRSNDGGYVVPSDAVTDATSLVSFGVNYDWSFEREFRKRNPRATIRCWDHTTSMPGAIVHGLHYIGQSFLHPSRANLREIPKVFDYRWFFRKEAVHVRKRIGSGAGDATIDEVFASAPKAGVFVKMDIEGGEYDVWSDLVRHADAIDLLAVEFHDLDTAAERFNACMDQALEHFHVVHIHGNNYAPQTNDRFPYVIELTLENKKRFTSEPPFETRSYPVANLDQPNDATKPDYDLTFRERG